MNENESRRILIMFMLMLVRDRGIIVGLNCCVIEGGRELVG